MTSRAAIIRAAERRRQARLTGRPEWQATRTTFPTTCTQCDRPLPKGTRIAWNPATRTAICITCN